MIIPVGPKPSLSVREVRMITPDVQYRRSTWGGGDAYHVVERSEPTSVFDRMVFGVSGARPAHTSPIS